MARLPKWAPPELVDIYSRAIARIFHQPDDLGCGDMLDGLIVMRAEAFDQVLIK
jgi:hypothetical protein